ncbi:MAG: FkbM family methyltransferase [Candidatus Bathyarchaeia archaeon]
MVLGNTIVRLLSNDQETATNELFPRVSIIVVNFKNLCETLRCLDALHTRMPACKDKCQLIVVDNGSNDGSDTQLRLHYRDVTVLSSSHNLGFAGANNRGIRYALDNGADYVFLLNNDAFVDRNTIKCLLEVFDADPTVGIVGATVLDYGNPRFIDNMGASIDYFTGNSKFIANGEPYREDLEDIDVDYACGAAMMIKREVIDKIGLLPEHYFLYGEEKDYCVHAKKSGYRVVVAAKARVIHKTSSTVKNYLGLKNYYFHRNRLIFLRLHARPDQYIFAIAHSLLVTLPFYLVKYILQGHSRPRESLTELVNFVSGVFDGVRFKTGYTKELVGTRRGPDRKSPNRKTQSSGGMQKIRVVARITRRPVQVMLLVRNWVRFLMDYSGLAGKGEVTYFLRNGLKFLARTNSKDKAVILEIFADRSYTPPGFEIHENDLIVDVGAHIGSFSIFAANAAKHGRVYALEPVPDNFLMLQRNIQLNGISNIVPVQKAMAQSSGEREIFVQLGDTTMHSFYNSRGEARKTLVKTTTLADFLRDYSIDRIDLLKMDCEGSEIEILMGCPDDVLARVKRISMESHPLNGTYSGVSMKDHLEQKGFTVTSNPSMGTIYAYRRENLRQQGCPRKLPLPPRQDSQFANQSN